ncbi:neurofilament light polypeptide-like [Acanthopagrus latus]|uniref:neurofilament light polypeptide-like n=1 Tax=Acanthopagrus latus TaxID=8177 RepID=UPI00187C0DFA|nr:neurofilament light polypeptide-like [Acanthopagrus latus]
MESTLYDPGLSLSGTMWNVSMDLMCGSGEEWYGSAKAWNYKSPQHICEGAGWNPLEAGDVDEGEGAGWNPLEAGNEGEDAGWNPLEADDLDEGEGESVGAGWDPLEAGNEGEGEGEGKGVGAAWNSLEADGEDVSAGGW